MVAAIPKAAMIQLYVEESVRNKRPQLLITLDQLQMYGHNSCNYGMILISTFSPIRESTRERRTAELSTSKLLLQFSYGPDSSSLTCNFGLINV